MIRRWLQELTLKRLTTIALGWCITLAGAVMFVALMGIGIAPLIANLMCKFFTTQVRFTLRRRTRPGARTREHREVPARAQERLTLSLRPRSGRLTPHGDEWRAQPELAIVIYL